MKEVAYHSAIDKHQVEASLEVVSHMDFVTLTTNIKSDGDVSFLSSSAQIVLGPRHIKDLRMFLKNWERRYWSKNKYTYPAVDNIDKVQSAKIRKHVETRDSAKLAAENQALRVRLRYLSVRDAILSLHRIIEDSEKE